MKPLKYICFVLSVLTAMSFTACWSNTTDTENRYFKLKNDPIVSATADGFVLTRFNKEYTDSLKPLETYGELLPFVGDFVEYKSTKEGSDKLLKLPKYGLCNSQGAVVVDAVYDAVKKHRTDEGSFVYELIKGSDGSDVFKGERYLTASDGSWGFTIPNNCAFRSVGADRVILERTRTVKNVKYTYLDFYDFKGKRRFIFERTLAEDVNTNYTIGAFSDGLAPVNVTVTDPENKAKKSYAYYIDYRGKKYYEKFISCSEFEKGYAVVQAENGLFGVIDTKGEWFFEPQYRLINYNSEKGYFACAKDGYFHIINMEKNNIKSILCDKGSIEIINSERLIYKKTNFDTGRAEYFYIENDKPFSCTETGQFPDSDVSLGGLFVCTYTGTGTIFNEDGENIVSIGDFGEMADRISNTVIVTDKNDKRVCFVTVSNKQRTDWIKYHYTRQSIGGRYIVLQNPSNSKYGLYDLYSNEFCFENCDFITVSESGKTQLLSVFSDGRAMVFDSSLKPLMNTLQQIQH